MPESTAAQAGFVMAYYKLKAVCGYAQVEAVSDVSVMGLTYLIISGAMYK